MILKAGKAESETETARVYHQTATKPAQALPLLSLQSLLELPQPQAFQKKNGTNRTFVDRLVSQTFPVFESAFLQLWRGPGGDRNRALQTINTVFSPASPSNLQYFQLLDSGKVLVKVEHGK